MWVREREREKEREEKLVGHIDETSFASLTKNKQKTWALKGVKNKLHNAEPQKAKTKKNKIK